MRYIFILLVAFGCSTDKRSSLMNSESYPDECYYETDTYYAPEYDTYFQWEFIGEWEQMTIDVQGKTGRWPKGTQPTDTARYSFYGHRIDVYTELATHHTGYQVIMDGVLVDSVMTRSELTGEQIVTWSDECLPLGNHVIELVKFNIGDKGSFVINGVQVYFYVDPDLSGWNPCTVNCDSIPLCPPCVPDTIYVEVPCEKPPFEGNQFLDDFEDGILHTTPVGWWNEIGWGASTVITDPTNPRNKTLNSSLPIVKYPSGSEARAQVNYNNNDGSGVLRYFPWRTEHGISFKMYFPNEWKPGPITELFFQLHQWTGSSIWSLGGPPFRCNVIGDQLRVGVRYSSERVEGADRFLYFNNQYTFEKNKLYYFVCNTYWDYRVGGDGYHKLYIKEGAPPNEDDLITDYVGPTGLNDEPDNSYTAYPTWGVYMSSLQNQSSVDAELAAGITNRTYLYDDILIQDSPIKFGYVPPIEHKDTILIIGENVQIIYK